MQLDQQVQQEPLVPQALLVLRAQRDLQDRLVLRVLQVRQERKVLQDLLGLRVLLVPPVLRVQLEQALQRCQIF